MYPVSLLVIGKTSFSYLREAEQEYVKRLRSYVDCSVHVLKTVKGASELMKQKEAAAIENALPKSSLLVLLDERGKHLSSREFASWIDEQKIQAPKGITFVIGGAEGFHDDLKRRADMLLSLSKMTFSHQLVRTIFLEQLYRACTISAGHPYHND